MPSIRSFNCEECGSANDLDEKQTELVCTVCSSKQQFYLHSPPLSPHTPFLQSGSTFQPHKFPTFLEEMVADIKAREAADACKLPRHRVHSGPRTKKAAKLTLIPPLSFFVEKDGERVPCEPKSLHSPPAFRGVSQEMGETATVAKRARKSKSSGDEAFPFSLQSW